MEGRPTYLQQPVRSLVQGMVFTSLFALPWINRVHLTTFLFIGLGVVLLLNRDAIMSYAWFGRQFVFLGFGLYYLLQLMALLQYPADPLTHLAVEQKAALLVVPLLFFILLSHYKHIWQTVISGFVIGNVTAVIICFVFALIRFFQSGDSSVFFYHEYASAVHFSAIYLSMYLVVALIYLIRYIQTADVGSSRRKMAVGMAVFLYLNLLLLSSKLIIAAGSILLLVMISRSLGSVKQKLVVWLSFAAVCLLILFTANPVSQRYRDINLSTYTTVFSRTNFAGFPFDGLNLRLLLWRMGAEVTNENNGWLLGNGGKHYHTALNEKIEAHKLYVGTRTGADTGYLNYNMHNQYMESYVQFGLLGAFLLMALLGYMAFHAWNAGDSILLYLLLFFGIVFLTEAALETQAGLLLFTIIISGEWIRLRQNLYRNMN